MGRKLSYQPGVIYSFWFYRSIGWHVLEKTFRRSPDQRHGLGTPDGLER
jgi:hypothetical protein